MNISKDGKTLYFSDEEIDNETNGEKKVFVTKRINGKESHVKVREKDLEDIDDYKLENTNSFNFNNEIIIGLDKKQEVKDKNEKSNKEKNRNKKKKKQSKHFKEATVQKRKMNKKKSKKKKSNKIIVTIFSIIILFAIILIFSLTAPIFNIVDIQVEGNEIVSKETIISLSQLKKGENIFKFNNSIISKIKENTYIESVNVSRKLPGTIKIMVEERKINYQINLINSYVYIDKNGYILENSVEKKQVPVISRT